MFMYMYIFNSREYCVRHLLKARSFNSSTMNSPLRLTVTLQDAAIHGLHAAVNFSCSARHRVVVYSNFAPQKGGAGPY